MRFCGRCGAALQAAPASAEERKVVTIVFADVVGSTRLSGTLDAEEVRERMARFFGIAREEIERFGGTVEKFIGDAVMAVFGLPTIHEDDPERAVHAAVAIRTHVRPFVEAGIVPQIRIGINTGEVVANPKAAEKGEFLVTGEVVNLAARLQQNAEPGQILAGASTYEATRWAFDYHPVAPLQVKGKDEKVPAYACSGLRAQPLAARGLPGVTSPLVGRDAEVATLVANLTQLLLGHGGVVTVLGEPGIGKSRLMAEVGRRVEDEDLRWLVGRTLSFSQSISYWPFLEIIKTAVGITEADGPAESWAKLERRVATLLPEQLPEVVPYLGTMLGLEVKEEYRERVRYLDGDAMGRQIYRTCRLFFERLAQERPLVLVVEDLHWIDESSSGLLEHLLPLVSTAPLLICAISRLDHETPAARLREVILRDYADRYTEIALTPLSREDSTALVRNLLQIDDLPARLRQVILEKTEGNPFFVEEVIRSLIDLGAIVHDDATGRWQVSAQIDTISIPDTLRGVIVARIDRLREEVKQVLKTAAVIGRSFFYRVLEAIADAESDLDRRLGVLERLDLIRERRRTPELEYIFKHGLTQEATYDMILHRVRRDLHRSVAATIEELFADRLEEFYGLLAFHYARAEDWEHAQGYLFKAGDQASRVAADAEALAHYRQAMAAYARAFGDRWDPLQRATLERKMGEALYRRGEHLQARDHYLRALSLLGSPFPTTRWRVQLAIVGEVLQQLIHLLFPSLVSRRVTAANSRAEERCRIYEAMGWIDFFVDIERVMLEALLIVNVAERQGLATWITMGTAGLGLICDHVPIYSLARRYHHRAVAMAEQIQHPLALGLAYLAWAFHEKDVLGLWETARDDFRRSAAAFRDTGDLRRWGVAATMVAWVSRNRGEFQLSLTQSEELLRVGEQTGDPQVLAWGLAIRGATLWPVGLLDEAIVHLERALKMFTEVPDYLSVVHTMSNLGMCYLRQAKMQDALGILEEAQQVIAAQHIRGVERTYPLAPLAETYFHLANGAEGAERAAWLRRAERVCRAALKQARNDTEGVPSAYRIKGTCEWLMGREALARVWWERSLTAAETLGARYEHGTVYLEIGTRLNSRDPLQRAEMIFSEIGARTDLSRVRDLLRKAS